MKFLHGGDIAGYEAEYGRKPIDFSASISPLGMPEGVARAIARSASESEYYPDPLCRKLRSVIAEKTGTTPEYIFCGNGSADIIYRAVLAERPKKAIVPAPSFGEYEAALRTVGCSITQYHLSEVNGFAFGMDFTELLGADTDMVFLCQPNNPTGRTIPGALLREILHRCSKTGTRLIIDESFIDFLDEPESLSLTGECRSNSRLVIIRSFTKVFAMAGVRLGYCITSDRDFIERMYLSGQPWSVSSTAQAAGIAALNETEYIENVREAVRSERIRLTEALSGMGLKVIPGEANYLMFRCGIPLAAGLRERGILIRSCGDFTGLDDSWYRIAVRTRSDDELLIQAIKEVLSLG